MKLRIKIILIISLGLLLIRLNSITTVFSEYKREDIHIAAIGDEHVLRDENIKSKKGKRLAELEIENSKIFTSWLENLSKKNIPTRFILESNKESIDDKSELVHSMVQIGYFLINTPIENISLDLADIRTKLFSLLEQPYFWYLDYQNRLLNNYKSIQNDELELFKKQITVKEYLNYSENIIQKIIEKNKEIKADIYEKDYINSKFKSTLEKFINIRNFLRNFNQDQILTKVLYDSFIQEIKQKQQVFYKLTETFAAFCKFSLIDTNYLVSLLEAIKNYKQIIILVGSDHLEEIDKFLNNIQFIKIKKIQGKEIDYSAKKISASIDQKQLKDLLNNAFSNITDIQNQIETVIKTSGVKLNFDSNTYCANCKKEAGLKCARCKIAFYCSQDCQKKDWKAHKQGCSDKVE